MRARGVAVGLAVAAWALVLVGGAASPAVATEAPPVDLTQWEAQMSQRVYGSRAPGSLLRGSTLSMTPIQRIAGVGRSVTASAATGSVVVPSLAARTASKFGTVARGAGKAVTGLFVLDLTYTLVQGGYAGGPGFMGLEGFNSEGLFCDLGNLVTGTGCSVGPAPEYLANADLGEGHRPGWAGVARAPGWWRQCTSTTMCPYNAITQSEYVFDVTGPVFGAGGTYKLVPVGPGSPYPRGMLTDGVWDAETGQPGDPYYFVWVATDGTWFQSTVFNQGTFTAGVVPTPSQFLTGTKRLDHAGLYRGDFDPSHLVASWYPVGHQSRPADFNANPARWWTTEWLCEGEAPHTATSPQWHESDPEWPTPPEPTCNASALTHVSVTENGTGLSSTLLYEWDVPAELAAATEAWSAAYPQCTDGSCILELARIDATTGTRLACFDNPALCLDWFVSPTKATDYQCTYGGLDVALDECNMYAPTFDPARAQPDVGTYGDPETGSTVTPAPLPEPDDGCPPPFSWSAVWNNWWLFKAVDCGVRSAGTALFVPKTLPGRIDQLSDTFQTRTPYPELASMAAALSPPEGGSVCMVLSLPLAFVLGHDQPFLDSCTWSDPVSAILRDYRLLFGAAVWVSVISPLAWWAWRQYAPGASGVA